MNEIKNMMEAIEKKRFFLAMKDHWDANDFAQDREWFNEWLALKNSL
jgi:hypothetical protein